MFPNRFKKISEFTPGDILEKPVIHVYTRNANPKYLVSDIAESKDRGEAEEEPGRGIPRRGSSQEGAKFIIVTPDRGRQARSTRE